MSNFAANRDHSYKKVYKETRVVPTHVGIIVGI